MIDLDSIFQYKVPNRKKLLDYGFTVESLTYSIELPIMNGQFNLIVSIEGANVPQFKVIETESKEVYILVHIKNAQGDFINKVRDACEEKLLDICRSCYERDLIKAEQTKRIVAYIKSSFGVDPEFLWEKSPNYAAFRKQENKKWFAVIMKLNKSKLGLDGQGDVEIINLKDTPENVQMLLNSKKYIQAYHMNKKYWFTACLDGSILDEELFDKIASSYAKAK